MYYNYLSILYDAKMITHLAKCIASIYLSVCISVSLSVHLWITLYFTVQDCPRWTQKPWQLPLTPAQQLKFCCHWWHVSTDELVPNWGPNWSTDCRDFCGSPLWDQKRHRTCDSEAHWMDQNNWESCLWPLMTPCAVTWASLINVTSGGALLLQPSQAFRQQQWL